MEAGLSNGPLKMQQAVTEFLTLPQTTRSVLMFPYARYLVILLVGMVLTGCASTSHHGLDPAARPHLDPIAVHFTIPQFELDADIDAAGAGYLIGGIVGGLVNMAIQNQRAEEAGRLLGPIRNQLIDYDHTDALKSLILSHLESIDWFKIGSIELHRNTDEDRYPKVLETSTSAAVAFIDAEYRLTSEFDAVRTKVSMVMFPRAAALEHYRKAMPDTDVKQFNLNTNIYRNTFEITTPVAHGADKDENAAALSQPGSPVVRDALEKNALEIARRIADDVAGVATNVD
jgi:hypothetical protein